MPTLLDHVLVAVLVVVFPLRAARAGVRRLRAAPPVQQPRLRTRIYAEAMVLQWTFTLVVLAVWYAHGRSWETLGLAAHPGPRFLAMMALVVGLLVAATLQVRRALIEDAALERTLERVRHVEAFMPHGPGERAMFRRLALTAGVCEELLYRGFLLWYLGAWMGPWTAALVASAVFGVGHAYQGWRGVLGTATAGLLFCAMYLVSGSLVPGMVAHAAIDLHAGEMTGAAFAMRSRRQAERALDEARVLEQMRSEAVPGAEDAAPAPPAGPAAAGGGGA